MDLSDFSWYTGGLDWLPHRTFFLTRHGSQCYGTSLPTSDLDIKGIAIAPKEYYFGFLNTFEQAEFKTPFDGVIYDIRKFFKLAADCNPNIIEILFTEESDWILPWNRNGRPFAEVAEADDLWWLLYQNRHLFLSRKARYTFSGYAHAQLKRIQTHRKWLLSPPKAKPQRSDFGLKNSDGTLGKDQLGVINSRIKKLEDTLAGKGATKDQVGTERLQQQLVQDALSELDLGADLLPIIIAERRYASAAKNWDAYQTWKSERNAARAELEAKFGYDAKHAMHLVRLMRMAKEILSGQGVIVKRPDAEELLQIRAGAWSFDSLMEWADGMDSSLEEIYNSSPLPHSPDRVTLDRLLVKLIDSSM